MARPRIVDRDIGAAKAGFQYSFILGAERLEFGRQQTHHLPLRNHHRHAIEKAVIRSQVTCPRSEASTPGDADGAIAADKPRIEQPRMIVLRPAFPNVRDDIRVTCGFRLKS